MCQSFRRCSPFWCPKAYPKYSDRSFRSTWRAKASNLISRSWAYKYSNSLLVAVPLLHWAMRGSLFMVKGEASYVLAHSMSMAKAFVLPRLPTFMTIPRNIGDGLGELDFNQVLRVWRGVGVSLQLATSSRSPYRPCFSSRRCCSSASSSPGGVVCSRMVARRWL